jgi:hypothetical protein
MLADKILTNRFLVDKKNQLDVTFCILYSSSNSSNGCPKHVEQLLEEE